VTIEQWLEHATADLEARHLGEAVPVVEAFAQSMRVLRAGEWNHSVASPKPPTPSPRHE
jgi:hypothetical protein